jgi:hypothetical protein
VIYRVKCRVNSRRNKKMETLENVPLRSHVYHPVWRHNKELFVIQGNCVSTVMMAISQTTDDHFANFYFVLKASYWKTENILRNALVESCLRQKKSPVFLLSMYIFLWEYSLILIAKIVSLSAEFIVAMAFLLRSTGNKILFITSFVWEQSQLFGVIHFDWLTANQNPRSEFVYTK